MGGKERRGPGNRRREAQEEEEHQRGRQKGDVFGWQEEMGKGEDGRQVEPVELSILIGAKLFSGGCAFWFGAVEMDEQNLTVRTLDQICGPLKCNVPTDWRGLIGRRDSRLLHPDQASPGYRHQLNREPGPMDSLALLWREPGLIDRGVGILGGHLAGATGLGRTPIATAAARSVKTSSTILVEAFWDLW